MRKIYFISGIVLVLFLVRCASQQKIEYNIPENSTEGQKDSLKIQLDKGSKLYKSSCSGCHGIFKKGKDSIPNFSEKQINLYKARHELKDPKNHAFAQKMPQEDLDAILNFLLLRKRS